jgi:mercuric ion binding protein
MIVRAGMFAALGLLLAPVGAEAADATVVLNVHHASCAACPSIVKKTLQGVDGVMDVTVGKADDKGDMLATIKYDDARASPEAMIKATTDHGYPAEVSKGASG